MKRILTLILAIVMILTITACAGNNQSAGENNAEVTFTFVVVDPEGNESTFEIATTKNTVGEALLEQKMIDGEEGTYGLYIKTVNGITLDWDTDQMYWAFYVDGEYALESADLTEIVPGTTYMFKAE